MIDLIDCNKVYRHDSAETHALRDVSLSVSQGEFLAIMGASGSGKSTLLHILGCMDRPSSGRYLYDGVDVNALSTGKWHLFRKKHIAFVFQNFALMNHYTVEENIALAMNGCLNAKKKKQIRETAEMLKITDTLDKLPIHISGGQQQRAAIARALLCEGELVLCDEPTGALDRKTGEEIMCAVKNLQKNGKTVIVVTHDSSVAKLADRILYMEDGRLLSNAMQNDSATDTPV